MAKFVSARQLSEVLGITERRVNQIANEGKVFTRDLNGKFDVVQCVESYYREKFIKDDDESNYDKERALHEKAKREKTELQLLKMRNRLHWAEDVEMVMTEMLVRFRNRILGVPTAIAPKLYRKSVPKIAEILKTELHSALSELSEYDPGMFESEEYEVLYDGETNDSTVQENSEGGSPAS